MIEIGRGLVRKMFSQLGDPTVQYVCLLGDTEFSVNPLIGTHMRLEYLGAIYCRNCGRKTKTSFSQGHCYPCMTKLAHCDLCIMKPELCHYDAGTCRDPGWGEKFCMTDHVVYLANSSGIKVGITRATQLTRRWIDQGAIQALPIMRVATRQQSGFVEDLFRSQVSDKTNWRALLKGDAPSVNLKQVRDKLFASCAEGMLSFQNRYGLQAIQPINDIDPIEIRYPVEQYPSKIISFNLDKNPIAEGKLLGIKGQYLILDTGVINIRKYTAYDLAVYQ